jgi:hypothetical protein
MVARLIVLAVAVIATAASTLEPNAASTKLTTSTSPFQADALVLRPQLDAALPCPVITGSPIGACPRPLLASAPRPQAMLELCPRFRETPFMSARQGRPSVCGTGFHPGDRVDVLIRSSYGSTFWRVTADVTGSFRSALPWPVCGLTPGRVMAVDLHDNRSNAVTLPSRGCP